MGSHTLITSVIRQATVLVAQLATAGGVRAPLAHVANQVFVDLARELEGQGVSRKVSADMFGMALRAYQRKLRRLTGEGDSVRSLWGELVATLRDHGPLSRDDILDRFARDDEATVRSVLRDLVETGLAVVEDGTYRAARAEELRVQESSAFDALLALLIYREGPLTLDELAERVSVESAALLPRLSQLAASGHLALSGERYVARDFSVPLGAEAGWEAAVLDHVSAVVSAIGQRLGGDVPGGAEHVGGSTYSFDIWDAHPLATEVEQSLQRFRQQHGQLRARVDAYNQSHGRPAHYRQVVVYGGQCVLQQDLADAEGEEEVDAS